MTESNSAPQRSMGRTLLRNSGFGLVAQFGLRGASFLFQVLVIRQLGDAQFGQYQIVLAWAMLFSVIGDVGITQYLTREIARDPKNTDKLFWDVVTLRFVLAIVATVITVGGAVLNGYEGDILIGILIYTSSYFLQAVLAPLGSVLVGNERVDISSSLGVVTQLLFIAVSVIFLSFGLDYKWLILASVVNMPIMIWLHLRFIRRIHLSPPRFHIRPALWWAVLRASFPFAFMQIALSFSYRVDTIFLSRAVTDAEIGWYNTAYTLTLTLLTFTRAFNDALLPSLAREYAINPDAVRPWYYRIVKGIMFFALPISIGGALLAYPIITLVYGVEYAPASAVFMILIWTIPFNIFHAVGGNIATSIKKEQKAANVFISMAVVNVALNLLLIPQYGILGAAFATVLTDMFATFQFYLLFRFEFGAGLQGKKLARLLLAGLLMGVLVFFLDGSNLFVIIGVAALFYLIAVWFSGAFSEQERRQLLGVVSRFIPRRYVHSSTS